MGDTAGSDTAGISVTCFCCVRDGVFVCVCIYMGRWVCQRAFTKGSALGVSMHCCKVGGSDLAADVANSQLAWKPHLNWLYSVQFSTYLFILVGGQMYVQWRWISVTGRIKERRHK